MFGAMAYRIHLPEAYHELDTPARGYLEHVEVRFDDGGSCELTFLDCYNQSLYPFYFEGQNVVVLEEVTREHIEAAVARMADDGSLRKRKK